MNIQRSKREGSGVGKVAGVYGGSGVPNKLHAPPQKKTSGTAASTVVESRRLSNANALEKARALSELLNEWNFYEDLQQTLGST